MTGAASVVMGPPSRSVSENYLETQGSMVEAEVRRSKAEGRKLRRETLHSSFQISHLPKAPSLRLSTQHPELRTDFIPPVSSFPLVSRLTRQDLNPF